MIYQGDTVRLKVYFKTFTGNAIDPADVKLTIYDINEEQIEQIILDDTNKEDVGVFYFDYVADKDIIFEFAGTYADKPILVRDSIKVKFN